jgi:flagellar protein FlgJ
MLQAATPTAADLTGLEQLRLNAARNDPAALKEAATQFDALFIGMMLKTARAASLGKGIFDNEATQQYLELMDDQVALELARKGGVGFGKLLLDQLAPHPAAAARAPASPGPAAAAAASLPSAFFETDDGFGEPLPEIAPELDLTTDAVAPLAAEDASATLAAEGPAAEDEAERFVRRFLADATTAARALGIEPRLLLAQAALETGWGKAIARHPDGRPANNLFGIKAGAHWRGERVVHWTIEHEDGVAARKREVFRAYERPADSFADYVDLIGGSPRYARALAHSRDPEAYARAVGSAGYATDPDYADKWLSIYRGERLGDALRGLKPTALAPTQ